ncbi:MAG: TonB-dependent receptor [Proteobacteria bacterium]|nr:TonB-dependent receptor [Pseudomonadota bacterium]
MKRAIPVALLLTAQAAHAQPRPPERAAITDIEVPVVVLEAGDAAGGRATADEALDLANIVQSAAKGVTTVQEAPTIVTVITADEIRDRQLTDLTQIYDQVPGWQRDGFAHSTFHLPLVRGQLQSVQFLHDGVSLFDPFVNIASTTRVQAIELVKRVEMITGPGGVLWGSNSLLGILNVITKDAEDVDGVEVGGTLGDGRGDRSMGRAYVMAGKSDLYDGKLKVFGHASVETYRGMALTNPLLVFHEPLPQPNSANQYGTLTTSSQPRSILVGLDGKITYDKLQLRVAFPFGEKQNPAGLSGQPVAEHFPGCADPTSAGCLDPNGTSTQNRTDNYDRYGVLEYRTRFAHDKAGLTARAYGIQFHRNFNPLQVLAPSATIPGGLSFAAAFTSYRVGGGLDGDVELSRKVRVLYGAEAFKEWKPDTTAAGNVATLPSPKELARLPILCPRKYDPARGAIVPLPNCTLTFAYPADRAVVGVYVDPTWRPSKRLILDVGARLQLAPDALGTLSYPLDTTLAGTVVWNFIPSWHLKLNYAQGFRPPVFNNTTSNGEAVQIGGNADLAVETSDAMQAEVNARLFKGERRIRELSFRADASYTRLKNLIQITQGTYANSGERGIASAEFLGKLYIQGGHRLELGYTWLRVDTRDRGRQRALPEHWFDLATVFALTPTLSATTNLKVTGAAEDPNRIVEYRDPNVTDATPVVVAATDLVLDRLPPIAQLSLGLTWVPVAKLTVRATMYDALVTHAYQPDVLFDYEPHLEYLPNPLDGFRAYVSATYQY